MLKSRGGFYAIVLGFIAWGIVAAVVGQAGQGANAGLRIAAIDRARLLGEYKYSIDFDKSIQKQQADGEIMLRTWAQNALLTEGDQKRMSDLAIEEQTVGTANFDAGKKAEVKKLQQQSADLGNEFTSLQGNQNPTPAQQMRLGVLTRAFSDTQTRVESSRKTITAELQKKDQEAQVKIVKDMKEAIAQVAKAKGFSLVLPTDIAYFSDNDITDAVLAVMNKK